MKGGQLSSFFAKKGVGKAKPVEEAVAAAAASIHTTSLFSDLPGEYFGSQGWDEGVLEGESPLVASQRQGESTGLETAIRSQLAVAVGELADDEGEDDEVMRRRIESEEARKKLEDAKVNTAKAALRRAQELGGGGGPLAPTPAAPTPSTGGGGTFAEAMAAKRAAAAAAEAAGGGSSSTEKHVAVSGVKNDRILSEDTKAFPSLSGSAPTPTAAPAKKAGNPWAKINIADMPVQETSAGVVGQATTTTATSSSAAAPTLASMALDALVYTGNQAALTTKAAVLEKSRFIIEELLGQGDSAEALRRFTEIRCSPVDLRAHVATGIIDASLDLATDMGKQMKVGKLLSLIVPARIVTRAQLISAVSSIMVDYEHLRVDFPKIDSQLGNVCSNGLVCGTLKEGAFASTGVGIPSHDAQGQRECGYVPVGYIAPNIAKNIPGLKDLKSAGTLLPKEEEGGGGVEGGGAGEEAGEGGAPTLATPPPPSDAAPAAAAKDDDEEGGGVKLAKKKKKAAVVEDDD